VSMCSDGSSSAMIAIVAPPATFLNPRTLANG
jgi:hypothetical protein